MRATRRSKKTASVAQAKLIDSGRSSKPIHNARSSGPILAALGQN
jgi:hypothetical protein